MNRSSILALTACAVLALASPALSSAQMTLGIRGGVSVATFGGSDADDLLGTDIDKGSRTGISVGASLAIPVASRFAIVPGAAFVQKGAQYSQDSNKATVKVNYIEIPIVASVMLTGENSPVGFNIFAGPTFAFESSCDIEFESAGTSETESCDEGEDDERQKFDIGLAGGAGVSIPVGDQLAVTVSAGYDLGLRKLDTSADPDDFKNSAFFASVGVGIPIG